MRIRRRGQAIKTTPPTIDTAKIASGKQIDKVLSFFRYNVGTSLDCSRATGVLRNNITWYIADLEEMGMLHAIEKRPDRTTGFPAKHYSADPTIWKSSTKGDRR